MKMCSHNRMSSAFNGYIPEISFISVDNFENKHLSAYFLSHYHGDHVFGLKARDFPEKLKANNAFIYASEVTAAIIKHEVIELSPYIKSLELGKNILTIKEDDKDIYLNVTTLPAGHSLGSVMFLFDYKQTILYTGDFRITQNGIEKYTHLHKNGEPKQIDAMYIDTTFQSVPSFPRRFEVVRNVIVYVENWLNANEKHRVVFITSAGYGYESICNEVYAATKVKTYISDKWSIFSQFPKEMFGITNDSTSRLHLITKNKGCYPKTPETLFIYFSAMKWQSEVNEENFINVKSKNEIDVCFSTHCGRDELLHFINYFQPKRIVGFPKPFEQRQSTPQVPELKEEKNEIPSKRIRRGSNDYELSLKKNLSKDILKSMFHW